MQQLLAVVGDSGLETTVVLSTDVEWKMAEDGGVSEMSVAWLCRNESSQDTGSQNPSDYMLETPYLTTAEQMSDHWQSCLVCIHPSQQRKKRKQRRKSKQKRHGRRKSCSKYTLHRPAADLAVPTDLRLLSRLIVSHLQCEDELSSLPAFAALSKRLDSLSHPRLPKAVPGHRHCSSHYCFRRASSVVRRGYSDAFFVREQLRLRLPIGVRVGREIISPGHRYGRIDFLIDSLRVYESTSM